MSNTPPALGSLARGIYHKPPHGMPVVIEGIVIDVWSTVPLTVFVYPLAPDISITELLSPGPNQLVDYLGNRAAVQGDQTWGFYFAPDGTVYRGFGVATRVHPDLAGGVIVKPILDEKVDASYHVLHGRLARLANERLKEWMEKQDEDQKNRRERTRTRAVMAD